MGVLVSYRDAGNIVAIIWSYRPTEYRYLSILRPTPWILLISHGNLKSFAFEIKSSQYKLLVVEKNKHLYISSAFQLLISSIAVKDFPQRHFERIWVVN